MEPTHDPIDFTKLFFPYASERQSTVQNAGARFVHYTSAEAAINMIKNKEVWLRKASCMNDYMEVEHGLKCLQSAYHGQKGKKLQAVLDQMFQGASEFIARWFDSMLDAFRYETYLLCVSEHRDSEDKFGRLSMWRAYGETSGVALVLNTAVFFNESDLKAYTSPVAYLDDAAFQEEFGRLVDGIEADREAVQALGRDAVTSYVFTAFKLASLCTKHPGFREELEWRVVYSPTLAESDHLVKDIQVIRGTPQTIYKIPLKNIPDVNFIGADISELLDRIIIGPTEYGDAQAMREAFRDLLACGGVDDPEKRIFISDIPLRQ